MSNALELGVNIDHVATLRQARRGVYPDPVQAAVLAELAGADQITVHLREDRRHIQDRDVRVLRQTVQTRLNLEMACSEEILAIALEIKPHRVTLVPERREELTTEGGLNVPRDERRLNDLIAKCKRTGMEVSLFIDADARQIEGARRVGADAVEFHTGAYATTYDAGNPDWKTHLDALARGARMAADMAFHVYAGHGLNVRNVAPIVGIPEIVELNIGHSIVARAVLIGMDAAVREMKACLHR